MTNELSLNIKAQDIPPIARHALESSQIVHASAEDTVKRIRDAIYPNWYHYEVRDISENLWPGYMVRCDTPQQALLAAALMPEKSHTTILIEEVKKLEEVDNTHPFVRALKGRMRSAMHTSLTGFGAMTILLGTVYAMKEMDTQAAVCAVIGTTLTLASMYLTGLRSEYLSLPENPLRKTEIS